MGAPLGQLLRCPLCKGKSEVVEASIEVPAILLGVIIRGARLPTLLRKCLAVACHECEFMQEIR